MKNKVKWTILFGLLLAGWLSERGLAGLPLPYVEEGMQDPEFWIGRLENPDSLLMTQEEIDSLNENSFAKGIMLIKLGKLKDSLKGDSLSEILKKGFWELCKEKRYGHTNYPLEGNFYQRVEKNMNLKGIPSIIPVRFGLITQRTNMRGIPTDEIGMGSKDNYEFDLFQYTTLDMGEPVAVLYYSQNKRWVFVQSTRVGGWVHAEDVAIARDREEVIRFFKNFQSLVVIGNKVSVFGDKRLESFLSSLQMGTRLPLLKIEGGTFVVSIPIRETDGRLVLREGYIPEDADVYKGFLPYTQRNLLIQAFKSLGAPYGWGGMWEATDCTRYILNIFACFGVILPRNSGVQLKVGEPLGSFTKKTPIKKKLQVLNKAIPGATIIGFPGHIMLYVGKYNNKYYVIHNIWGYRRRHWFTEVIEKVSRVVVSDLNLGEGSKRGSLLERLRGVRGIYLP